MTGIDITEKNQLEQAILDASVRERLKIGQDLHDGLGQHLTGIALMSKALEQKLASTHAAEAADAAKIVKLANEAICKIREIARGLLPVLSGDDGLVGALQRCAADVEELSQIRCELVCADPVPIADLGTATHLFHIAQEAVNNALRHADPQRIVITVERNQSSANIAIEDDGAGIDASNDEGRGLGLRIMSYRAWIIGGSLEVLPGVNGGTVVRCRFPIGDRGTIA